VRNWLSEAEKPNHLGLCQPKTAGNDGQPKTYWNQWESLQRYQKLSWR
jgi:hypothetical protein